MSKSSFFVIRTDFSIVRITDKALEYVGGEEGLEIINNKRKRGKKAKYLRQRMKNLETAVSVMSEIAYRNGDELGLF